MQQNGVESEVKGLILGFDLGNSKSVVALSASGCPVGKADLVVNEMSNRATPTLVSFHGSERSIGEKAQGQLGVNPKNTVTNVRCH
jgi:molecular chaperone DnaK (HSP70)